MPSSVDRIVDDLQRAAIDRLGRAAAGQRVDLDAAPRLRGHDLRQLLLRMLNRTEIGRICVSVTIPVPLPERTRLPTSTLRMPVRPSIGEVMIV